MVIREGEGGVLGGGSHGKKNGLRPSPRSSFHPTPRHHSGLDLIEENDAI